MAIVEKYETPVLEEYRRIWSKVILETIHPAVGTRNFEEFEWNIKFNEEKTQISLGFMIILRDIIETLNKYNKKILVKDRNCDKQGVYQEFPYDENTTIVQDLVRYSVKVIKDALNNPLLSLKTLVPRLSTYDFDKVINDSFRLNDLKNGDFVLNAEGNAGIVIRDTKNFCIVFNNDYIPARSYNEYLESSSIPEYNIVKVFRHNHACDGLQDIQEKLKVKSQKDCDNRVMPFDKTKSFYITEEELKRKLGLDKDVTIVIKKD